MKCSLVMKALQRMVSSPNKFIPSISKVVNSAPNIRPFNIEELTFDKYFSTNTLDKFNLNIFMQLLAKYKKPEEVIPTITKMATLNIHPGEDTYSIAISCLAKGRKLNEVLSIYDKIKDKKEIMTIGIYNGVMLAYVYNYDPYSAEKIFNEIKTHELIPDTVCYTTLMEGFFRVRNYNKCKEIFYHCRSLKVAEEYMYSIILKICAITFNTGEAISLFSELKKQRAIKYCIPYNAYINALCADSQFCSIALEVWEEMKLNMVMPNDFTFQYLLKACSKLGDIDSSLKLLREMKAYHVSLNSAMNSHLISTYANAIFIKKVRNVQQYIDEGWKLFNRMVASNIKISHHTLNAMIRLLNQGEQMREVEEKILPLFKLHQLLFTGETYLLLISGYHKQGNLSEVWKYFMMACEGNINLSNRILSEVLLATIDEEDEDKVNKVLNKCRILEKKILRNAIYKASYCKNLTPENRAYVNKYLR